jgi:arginyl-tRNA synthetase
MRQANSHFDFDLDLAVEQSNENPVFYVQYAHARICSILRLMEQENVQVKAASEVDLSLLCEPQEVDLMKLLAHFPEEIRAAAISREPSRMTRYVMELAAGFHTFYGACRVKTEDKALQDARLVLVNATKTVIKNALTLLSIEAPEQM